MSMEDGAKKLGGNTVIVLLSLALGAYLLPWVVAPNASMTLNAFDLAEWTSLHPLQQQARPPLMVPLLLRIHLPILAMLMALWPTSREERYPAILFIVLLSVSQLPPLEFINNLNDLNYRQLLCFALATLFLSTILRRFLPAQLRPIVALILALLGIVTSLVGQSQAIELYQLTLEKGTAGGGLWLMVLTYNGISLSALRQILRR